MVDMKASHPKKADRNRRKLAEILAWPPPPRLALGVEPVYMTATLRLSKAAAAPLEAAPASPELNVRDMPLTLKENIDA